MSKRFSILGCLLAASVLMGCAAPVAPAAPTSAAPAKAPAELPTSTPAPTAAPEQAAKGGSLTIGIVEEPETLNPYITQLATSYEVLSGVMEGLLGYDEKQAFVPMLAESYEVSADGLTYTFKLRKNVKWHDGKPFTAADVMATWKIIMNQDFGAFNMLGWEKITDMQTPDDFTVIMKTAEKYAPFLSYVGTGIISPKHKIDEGLDKFKQDFGRKPIGTGPFMLSKWDASQAIELTKNKDYWRGEPNLDSIRLKIVPDDNTLFVQLGTGETQMAIKIAASRYAEATALANSQVAVTGSSGWTHIDLKMIDFLQDTKVRQALDFATPRAEIVEKLLKGLAIEGFGDQTPGTPWYNTNIKPRPYDLDQAAKLLEEAGFKKNADGILEKDGKPFELEYWVISGDQQTKQVQQVIAASWTKLGIKVDAREEDIKSIFGPNGYQFTKKMTGGQYGWTNGNDPDDMFYWHSSQIPADPTGTGGNVQAFFNKFSFQKEIDDLTASGVKEVDPAKRAEIYWKVQEVLQREVPVIFLYWAKDIYVVPKNLANFKPNPFNYTLWNAGEWALQK